MSQYYTNIDINFRVILRPVKSSSSINNWKTKYSIYSETLCVSNTCNLSEHAKYIK